MITREDYKALFVKYLDTLHEEKGISLKKIAEASGIDYSRIRQIRKGRSTGRMEDVVKLETAYPELIQQDRSDAEIEILSREFQNRLDQLQGKVIRLLDAQKEEYDKKIASLEKKLQERD